MDLSDLLSPPMAFHRSLVPVVGSINAAIFISQAIYWSKIRKKMDGGEWFYKTHEEWSMETALTRHEQATVRERLRKLGVIEEQLKGMPRKVHYRVNFEVLRQLIKETKAPAFSCTKSGNWSDSESESGHTVAPEAATTNIGTETTHKTTEKAPSVEDALSEGPSFVELWNEVLEPEGFPAAGPTIPSSPEVANHPRLKDALDFVAKSDFYKGEGRQLGALTPSQFLNPKIFAKIIEGLPAPSAKKKTAKSFWEGVHHGVRQLDIYYAGQEGVEFDIETGEWSDGGKWYAALLENRKNPPLPPVSIIHIGLAEDDGVKFDRVTKEWSDGGEWYRNFCAKK